MIELEFNYVFMCDMKDNFCVFLKVFGIECFVSVYQCLCLIIVFQKYLGYEYFIDVYNLYYFFLDLYGLYIFLLGFFKGLIDFQIDDIYIICFVDKIRYLILIWFF